MMIQCSYTTILTLHLACSESSKYMVVIFSQREPQGDQLDQLEGDQLFSIYIDVLPQNQSAIRKSPFGNRQSAVITLGIRNTAENNIPS